MERAAVREATDLKVELERARGSLREAEARRGWLEKALEEERDKARELEARLKDTIEHARGESAWGQGGVERD